MTDHNREALAKFLLRLRSRGITDHRLLTAFEHVPRKNFVPIIHITEAYAPGQMPIECGQSMTAVSMVARVLSALDIEPQHRVLELGTGTGYQAALMGVLGEKINTVERYRTLHEKAQTRLKQLGMDNVLARFGDGSAAQTDLGIHDRIVSNFAFEDLPRDFIDNLSSNGIMIAPVGPKGDVQIMKRITKVGSRFQVENLFPVRMQHAIRGTAKVI